MPVRNLRHRRVRRNRKTRTSSRAFAATSTSPCHAIRACGATFDVRPGVEVTLEANPESVSEQSLAGYREAGVNRLSFGVQSFDDTELSRLGRLHSAQRARAAVGEARAAGFDNLSLDLMLWLPGQRLDEWLDARIGADGVRVHTPVTVGVVRPAGAGPEAGDH